MPQTIRIKPETREALERLAQAESIPMTRLLDKMVDTYRRQRFLAQTNAAFARLKSNPKAREHERKERAAWDATLADGLKDDAR